MIAWVRALVAVTPQAICRTAGRRDRKEKSTGSASPGCRATRSQSMLRAVEPRRRPGLQPAERQAEVADPAREADRGRVAGAPRRAPLVSDVDHAAQEGAGGQDHRPGAQRPAGGEHHARRRTALDDQVDDLVLDHPQLRPRPERRLHRRAVERAVGLRARALGGRRPCCG